MRIFVSRSDFGSIHDFFVRYGNYGFYLCLYGYGARKPERFQLDCGEFQIYLSRYDLFALHSERSYLLPNERSHDDRNLSFSGGAFEPQATRRKVLSCALLPSRRYKRSRNGFCVEMAL